MFYRQFKWAYQRITKGFCDFDIWDLDNYYLELFYQTIIELANITHGYPGTEEFPTPEAWDKYLREMANNFYRANESNNYYNTPMENIWWEDVKNDCEPWNQRSQYSDAMLNEAYENDSKRNIELNLGLDKLKHVFRHLWD